MINVLRAYLTFELIGDRLRHRNVVNTIAFASARSDVESNK